MEAVNEEESSPTLSNTSIPSNDPTPCLKKRIGKSGRLQQSLKTNERFMDLNQQKFMDDKFYQEKKIAVREREVKNNEIFQNRVASAFENIAESLAKIAEAASKLTK